MDWVRDLYSATGRWWGRAEGRITERDHRRVEVLHEHAGRATPMRVLELGSGYGATAAALANAGHSVTAVEISDRLDYRVPHDGPGTVEVVNDDFYAVRLRERTSFDPVTCTAADTWWDVARPDEKITQTLGCYTPADLLLLLEGTGLALTSIGATGRDLLDDRYEYLAALRRRGAS
jgi:SAM-dependent methyltransferase